MKWKLKCRKINRIFESQINKNAIQNFLSTVTLKEVPYGLKLSIVYGVLWLLLLPIEKRPNFYEVYKNGLYVLCEIKYGGKLTLITVYVTYLDTGKRVVFKIMIK